MSTNDIRWYTDPLINEREPEKRSHLHSWIFIVDLIPLAVWVVTWNFYFIKYRDLCMLYARIIAQNASCCVNCPVQKCEMDNIYGFCLLAGGIFSVVIHVIARGLYTKYIKN
jgi:hypothetical protein